MGEGVQLRKRSSVTVGLVPDAKHNDVDRNPNPQKIASVGFDRSQGRQIFQAWVSRKPKLKDGAEGRL